MGPDGAIDIADWYNPIIPHGEVDFRDLCPEKSSVDRLAQEQPNPAVVFDLGRQF